MRFGLIRDRSFCALSEPSPGALGGALAPAEEEVMMRWAAMGVVGRDLKNKEDDLNWCRDSEPFEGDGSAAAWKM